MSYQPEERYWTDYLRVAMPVAGLLLMLAVFWVWASNVIDADSSDDEPLPTATAAVVVDVITPSTSTPAPTADVDVSENQTPVAPGPGTTEEADPADGSADGEAETADGEGTGGRLFAIDSTVLVTNGPVRLRGGPSTDDEIIIEEVATGTALTVTGAPQQDAEGNDWYPLTTEDGTAGFIRNDFLEAAE